MGRLERRLNAFPQFRSSVDGLGIHFLHVRSKHANALPIILTHGWPGSMIEFLDVIGPLTDPQAHGGRAEDGTRNRCSHATLCSTTVRHDGAEESFMLLH